MDVPDFPIGIFHCVAASLSFTMSLRMLTTIVLAKDLRKQETFQLLASIFSMECLKMSFALSEDVRLVMGYPSPSLVDNILGSGAIICWIGEAFQKFALAIKRFLIVAEWDVKLGKPNCLHLIFLISPWLLVLTLGLSCVYQFTSFGIVKELNAWIYREDTFVRSLEKYSTLILSTAGLFVYLSICINVIMTRQSGASKTEIRLLMAFLFDFSYVVIVVSSFHILPKFVDYGIITVWIINFFWHLIPFAGGVALLLINKNLRRHFFCMEHVRKFISIAAITKTKVSIVLHKKFDMPSSRF